MATHYIYWSVCKHSPGGVDYTIFGKEYHDSHMRGLELGNWESAFNFLNEVEINEVDLTEIARDVLLAMESEG